MIIQKKRKASLPFLIGVLILLTLVSAVFVLCLGAVRIPVEDTFRLLRFIITGGEIPDDLRTVYRVVWLLRAQRVILGFAAGCGLDFLNYRHSGSKLWHDRLCGADHPPYFTGGCRPKSSEAGSDHGFGGRYIHDVGGCGRSFPD